MFRKTLFILSLFIPCTAFADTIYLKNGRQIKDVDVIEDGSLVKYHKYGMEVRLLKNDIDRIDRDSTKTNEENSEDNKLYEPHVNVKTEKDKERERWLEESQKRVKAIMDSLENMEKADQ